MHPKRLLRHCGRTADVWGYKQREPSQRARRREDLKRFMTGRDRAFVYRLAVETALRAGVLRSLTVDQVRFERDEHQQITGATIRTSVGQQKNRRPHDVPVQKSFAVELERQVAGKAPSALVSPKPMPSETR